MNELQSEVFEDVIENGPFPIRFPQHRGLDQDEEWCEVRVEGEWQRVRFHDYDEVYRIPGLYETIYYRTLRCNSPNRVASLLDETLKEHWVRAEELSVLDVGAGNGMVGEVLQNLGTRSIVGIDIIPEAKEATERDRPWVYNDYFVADLTDLPPAVAAKLGECEFNAMTVVAALGYGDIPPQAFYTAYNLVADGGWLAFNIKEDFLKNDDDSGFAGLVHRMTGEGLIQMEAYRRYCHRLSISGEPLYYVAAVAQKKGDIPPSMLD